MFYLSKPFLETKTHFSIQIHRTLYVRESKPAIILGRFPFVRTGRQDHCRTSKFDNRLFPRVFAEKSWSPLVHTIQDLTDLAWKFWLKEKLSLRQEWSGRSVLKSGRRPKARLPAAILKMSPHSPTPTEQRRLSLPESWIRDSGFEILDYGFLFNGTWIPDFNRYTDSKAQDSGLQKQSPDFLT